MATIKLPNIPPITQLDLRNINSFVKQLQNVLDVIRKELQNLEDNKTDA